MKKILFIIFMLVATKAFALTEIMLVGDSIVDYGAPVLEALLDTTEIVFVGPYTTDGTSHAGIAGDESEEVEARIVSNLSSFSGTADTEIILLHIGTNDMVENDVAADVVDNVEDIIDLVHAADPTIEMYVALIIPPISGNYQDTLDYNDALDTMLQTYQGSKSNLYIVDHEYQFINYCHRLWTDTGVLMNDSLHPSDLGYAVMSQTWGEALADNGGVLFVPTPYDNFNIDEFTELLMHGELNCNDSSTEDPESPTCSNVAYTGTRKFANYAFDLTAANAYIEVDGTNFSMGAKAFTVDFWIYLKSIAGEVPLLMDRDATFRLFYQQSVDRISWLGQDFHGWSPQLDTWYHIEAVRCPIMPAEGAQSRIRVFVNGVQIDDAGQVYAASNTSTNNLIFGYNFTKNGNALNGYMDEIRVSTNQARHCANFTPETEQYGGLPYVTIGTGTYSGVTLY